MYFTLHICGPDMWANIEKKHMQIVTVERTIQGHLHIFGLLVVLWRF